MAPPGNSPPESTGDVAVRLEVNAHAVAGALAAADAWLRRANADEDLRARLSIIVEELVINIVEHGRTPPGDVIGLTLRTDPEGVRLTLTDGGDPFDLRDAVRGDDVMPPERGGGAGIALVLAWSRIAGYVRANGRNRLELVVADKG